MHPRPRQPVQAVKHLPVQFTSFVGRAAALGEVRQLVVDNRLVTLCGAGGVGKTRLAIEIAPMLAPHFPDGICYWDLAPIGDPAVVPMTLIRALDIVDQPGRSSLETVVRCIGDARVLMVIDNCEHLIDVCVSTAVTLMTACPGLSILATSREPIGVAGEVTWRVPTLSLEDEAVALFVDRVRLARPRFAMGADRAVVLDICRQLDGMPLAIELAAARMRAMSLTEIGNSLQDRFGLLTAGARTALPRHQTLRASVEWSHALLTEAERVLFRRLAVFAGGFDAAAAAAVAGDDDDGGSTMGELLSLVDKSLVQAEENRGGTRYRLLETVRQYAMEKLTESDEFSVIRARHCTYYSGLAADVDEPYRSGRQQLIDRVEAEIDNLRGAFGWCRDVDIAAAVRLASSLQPLWLGRGHTREGLAWFESIEGKIATCADESAVVRAVADRAMIDGWMGQFAVDENLAVAQKALRLARDSNDPALLVRALTACGSLLGYNAAAARPYLAEATGIARGLGDRWRLSQILYWQAVGAMVAGDPIAGREVAEEALEIADAIGDRFVALVCGVWHGFGLLWQGQVVDAITRFQSVVAESDSRRDPAARVVGLLSLGQALAYRGDIATARAVVDEAVAAAAEFGEVYAGTSHAAVTYVALAAADIGTAASAAAAAWRYLRAQPDLAAMYGALMAQAALAHGDVAAAREFAGDAASSATGWHRMVALIARARTALAQGEFRDAERDAQAALACGASTKAYLCIADAIECSAIVAVELGDHLLAARLGAAAESARKQTGESRFQTFQPGYSSFLDALRGAMGEEELASAWADGAKLTIEETITYARRRRGARKRPFSGWAALTPTEREVVRLVGRGLSNSEIANKLFVSPRTVETHLTHAYAKLGAKSRIQLAQEASRYV